MIRLLNLNDFAREYADHYNTTIKEAKIYCSSVFALLGKILYEDEKGVGIYGFGSFTPTVTASRRNKHPITGKISIIPERKVVKFRQAGKTKKTI